jgi:phosphohistidine phosphatase
MADFDRPLNSRGIKQAEWACGELSRHATRPAAVLCSPARRTRETLAALAGWLGDAPVTFDQRIYEAGVDALMTLLRGQAAASILMVGHNPGFETLARVLAGSGDNDALRRLARKYPPAAHAIIEFEMDSWAEVKAAEGRLVRFSMPDD